MTVIAGASAFYLGRFHRSPAGSRNTVWHPGRRTIGGFGLVAFSRSTDIAMGVRQRLFGDMPRVRGSTRSDAARITTCVRKLQPANGIE